jgi:hypothetical protein
VYVFEGVSLLPDAICSNVCEFNPVTISYFTHTCCFFQSYWSVYSALSKPSNTCTTWTVESIRIPKVNK